jgi:hypothetical protein
VNPETQLDASLVIQSLLRQIAQQAERIAILEAQMQQTPQDTIVNI